MGYNKRNDEINAITKESIAFAYCELLQNEQNISVTMICEKAGVSRNAYIFCWDNDLSEKLLNQIYFIVLFDCPHELFFRIKELNQSLLQYFSIFWRHRIDFTILCPFQNQAVYDD